MRCRLAAHDLTDRASAGPWPVLNVCFGSQLSQPWVSSLVVKYLLHIRVKEIRLTFKSKSLKNHAYEVSPLISF